MPTIANHKQSIFDLQLKRRLLLVLLAVATPGVWRLAAWVSMSGERRLADELASVNVYVGPAIPNPAGTQILFEQNTEDGIGICTADMKSARPQQVFEVEEAFVRSGSVGILGWSPDGTVFGYTIPVKSNKQHIVVCSGYVSERIDSYRVDSQVASFAWISANRFVYGDENKEVRIVARNRSGKWALAAKASFPGAGEIEGLTVTSDGAALWKQGRSIRRMNLVQPRLDVLWDEPAAARVDFAYAHETGKLLIGVGETTNGHAYSVTSLYAGPPRVAERLQRVTGRKVVGLKLINWGRDYALICAEPSGRTLLIGKGGEMKPADVPLFPDGNVQYVTPQGGKLYIVGSTNVEPPGVWEYDCERGTTRVVLAGSAKGMALYGKFRHEARVLETGGREITYHLWMPEPSLLRRQFPLIIGQTPYGWTPYPYVAARAGYCFVTVDRPTWRTDLENWAEDVMAVYEALKSHPRVNTRDVCLYGRSAETHYLSTLAAEKPGLWKAALLFSPGPMPDAARCGFARIFVDVGARDHDALERLPRYQSEAARQGLPVRLLIHETSRHTSWSRATQRARLENLAEFLSDR